jgi:hypothetical protein
VNAPALAVVCLRPPPGSAAVHVIVAKVLESGAAWVSAAQFGGEPVIRACITHGETSDADIDAVLELLDRCRLG